VPSPVCEENLVSNNLPALAAQNGAVVEKPGAHVPRRFSHDLVRHLREADSAARFAGDPHGNSDITVVALTAVNCVGSSQAEVLQSAANWSSEAPHMEIHATAWARMPGPVEDTWEWHLTMTVSSRDPQTGDFDGSTHTADRRPCRVRVYRDVATEAALPTGAFTALERPGMHQAEALQATADALRALPDLEVEGLLWARVPTLRGDSWEYRLTVLTASLAPGLGADDEPTYYQQR
jgi:hypothetical protein